MHQIVPFGCRRQGVLTFNCCQDMGPDGKASFEEHRDVGGIDGKCQTEQGGCVTSDTRYVKVR